MPEGEGSAAEAASAEGCDPQQGEEEKADRNWRGYLERDSSPITDLFLGQLKVGGWAVHARECMRAGGGACGGVGGWVGWEQLFCSSFLALAWGSREPRLEIVNSAAQNRPGLLGGPAAPCAALGACRLGLPQSTLCT